MVGATCCAEGAWLHDISRLFYGGKARRRFMLICAAELGQACGLWRCERSEQIDRNLRNLEPKAGKILYQKKNNDRDPLDGHILDDHIQFESSVYYHAV